MSKTNFDWDKYFSEASWNNIYINSPFFIGQRFPSLIIEEKGLIYLSSLDLGFSITEVNDLNESLEVIKSIFKNSLEHKNYYKAAIASADFNAIKNILSQQGIQNSEFLED